MHSQRTKFVFVTGGVVSSIGKGLAADFVVDEIPDSNPAKKPALDYKQKVGNRLAWYSSSESPFAADMDAPPGGGFAVNVFLRPTAATTTSAWRAATTASWATAR